MKAASRAARWLCVALLAITAVGFFAHRVLVEQPQEVGFENYDLLHYMVPSAQFLRDSLQRGEFPAWNPYQFAGQPFAATHITSVFYAPHLFFTWMLPVPWALAAHTVVHLFLAALFTLLLAARLGLSWPAQLTAALGYMLSGALLAGLYNTPYMATHAWLPGILWSLHGLATEVRMRWALAAGVTAAMAFLGGHAQAFFYEAQLGFLWFGFLWTLKTPRGMRPRALILAAVGALLAFGLVAPQLFATLEFAELSNRHLAGHEWADAFVYSYPEARLWKGLQGEPGSGVGIYRWTVAFPVLLTFLAVIGFFTRAQRTTWLFFAAAAVFAALFSLGPAGSLYRFYFGLPLGDLFRGAARISFIYAFGMALLGGIGVQAFVNGIRILDLPRWCPTAAGLILALAVGLSLYARTELTSAHPVSTAVSPGAPENVADFMKRQAVFDRVFIRQPAGARAPELTRKAGMMNRFFAVPDYEPALVREYETFFAPRSSEIWHGNVLLDPSAGRPAEELSRALDLMSVRFIVPVEMGRPVPANLRAVGAKSIVPGTPIARRPHSLPRAYSVEQVVAEPGTEAAIRRVMQPSFRPHRQAVVLEGALEEGDSLLAPPNDPRPRQLAQISRYGLDEVEIQASCGSRCLLVLTDLDYPGWSVSVDGEPRPVLRANGIFRGVVLSAGTHEVVYRYDSPSLRAGLAVSVVILGGFAVALLMWGWRRTVNR